MADTSSGARSARGTSTKPRVHIRGWGTTRSALVDSVVADEQDVDVEGAGPHRSSRTRSAAASAAWAAARSSSGGAGGRQLDDAVEIGALPGGPPTGSVS